MKTLCRAIIWIACFLEMSEDEVVDPDSAVKALEDLASVLQQATEGEKRTFAEVCAEESAKLQKEPGYAQMAEFVRGLPAVLGI
jgi:hypothetical protein